MLQLMMMVLSLLVPFQDATAPPVAPPAESAATEVEVEAPIVLPEDPDDRGRALFRLADEATAAVRTLRYRGTWHGTGSFAARFASVEAVVIVDEVTEPFGRYRIDGHFFRIGDEGPERADFIAGFDGKEITHLNLGAKTVVHLPIGQRGELSGVLMGEYTAGHPFTDEINGDMVDYEGLTLIGDVECHVVYVEYAGRNRTARARWYFGTDDFLPRRVERLGERDGLAGARVLSVYDLEVDCDIQSVVFGPPVPDDFTEPRLPPGMRLQPGFRRGF